MLNYNISFYLRANRQQADGRTPIYIRVRLDNDKLELSTEQNIEPQHWNAEKQTVIKTSKEAALINSVISRVKDDVLQAITNLQLTKAEVSVDNLRKMLKGEPVAPTYTLLKVVQEHNTNFEKQVGVQYSQGSYKNYKTSLAFLKEFINGKYHKHDLPLKQIDHKFCEQYCIWLTTEKTCHQNGSHKHIQRLKKILNYAVRMGYIAVSPITGYIVKLKVMPRVALTWEEIDKIHRLELSTERLLSIRDIFLFQVYTGLAYSDVKAFCSNHLWRNTDSKVWVRMERTKTRSTFTVPLLQPALEILQKYLPYAASSDMPIFPVLSNQKMNYNLKIIQEIAGIIKPLHTHLPRHTFATTITLMNGVPIETVSKMLGHSKITMTQTYARVGELKIEGDMLLLQEKLSKTKRPL